MQNLPIGIQSFEKIREGGYVYVDKTEYICELLKQKCCYFLSRPRRFGKSLFLSTLEAYFQGRKELFAGLAIDTPDRQWKEYPVIYIDLNLKKLEKYKNADIIILIVSAVLVIAVLIYFSLKSYPVDYVDGKVIVDPKKMIVKGFDINAAQTEDSISESGNSSAEGEDIKKYSGLPLDIIGNNRISNR